MFLISHTADLVYRGVNIVNMLEMYPFSLAAALQTQPSCT